MIKYYMKKMKKNYDKIKIIFNFKYGFMLINLKFYIEIYKRKNKVDFFILNSLLIHHNKFNLINKL